MQPRHHLLDRRQLPRRSGFAARAGRALWTLLALRSGFASCPLRSSLAAGSLRTGLALWPGLAARSLRTGLALRPRFAARTFQSGPSGMALRPGPSGLAARPLRALFALPDIFFVRHVRAPGWFSSHPYQRFDDGINCADGAGGFDQHQSA